MIEPVLTYYQLGTAVQAFSTTRHGGVSKGNYGEFNINEYCGDAPEAISENRKALSASLKIGLDHIIMPHQTHGITFREIGPEFFALSENTKRMLLEGVDGLMTSLSGVCIGVSTADCIPVLLYDEDHHAACAVHSGWRGTVQYIVLKAVAEMREAYSSDPQKLKAIIGPGISLENFEVGPEVYEQFASNGFDMSLVARKYEKWHIDLPECCRIQLIGAGVSPQNIQKADVCTYSHADDYFSARRLGIQSGRIFTAIMLQ
jgi:YfiH family protein